MSAPGSTLLTRWGAALEPGRIAAVDELKGLAILLVMAFHTELAMDLPPRSQGFIGVDVFLLLSGWTIARSLRPDERASTFFSRRMLRVFPAYWMALVLFGIMKAGMVDGALDFQTLWIHALALQAFASPSHFFAINPSFWFMSLLLVVYPVAYLCRREMSPYFWLCLGIALAMVTYALAAAFHHDTLRAYLPPRLISFSIGFALARALRPRHERWTGETLCCVTLVASMYLESRGVPMLVPALFALSICVAYVSIRGGLAAPSLATARWVAPLAALGGISYEVFLLHQPLLRLSLKLLALPETPGYRLASACLGISGSIAAGWLLHQLLAWCSTGRKALPSILPAASKT